MTKRELPPYCYRKGKKGYVYYVRHGVTQRIHAPFGTAEFAAEYALAMRGRPPAPKRTIKGLIQRYQSESDWQNLAKNTKKSYSRHLRFIEENIGHIDPATLRTVHVYEMRDAIKDTPTDANRKVGVLSTLLGFGRQIGWVDENVAFRAKKLPGKRPERQPWPQDKITAFREAADSRTRLLFEILLGTGQRIGDVLAMKWADIEGDGIHVTQGKTKRALYVPFTDTLRRALDDAPRISEFILAQDNGRPLSYQLAHKNMMELRKQIGAMAWDIHALRHSAASELASLPGMTSEHVMAITGHTSREMVQRYAGRATQKARAKEAQNARGSNDER